LLFNRQDPSKYKGEGMLTVCLVPSATAMPTGIWTCVNQVNSKSRLWGPVYPQTQIKAKHYKTPIAPSLVLSSRHPIGATQF
jgi:hypothetical protein